MSLNFIYVNLFKLCVLDVTQNCFNYIDLMVSSESVNPTFFRYLEWETRVENKKKFKNAQTHSLNDHESVVVVIFFISKFNDQHDISFYLLGFVNFKIFIVKARLFHSVFSNIIEKEFVWFASICFEWNSRHFLSTNSFV